MDIFNSIKEWFSGLFGDAADQAAEAVNADEIQQNVNDAVEGATGGAQDAANAVSEQVEKTKDNIAQ